MWQNKDKKSWQNNKRKGDKPHATCFTLSQDQKFFVPADCDENVFQIICTLVKTQINKSGGNTKEINEISKDTLVNLLNISGETYDAAQSAVQEAEKDEISSLSSSTD